MIVGPAEVYEVFVSFGVAIGIGYLLYSGDFVTIHRTFLFRIAVGAGLSGLLRVGFLLVRPSVVSLAQIPLIIFILIGFLSLVRGHPTHKEKWFKTLFRV